MFECCSAYIVYSGSFESKWRKKHRTTDNKPWWPNTVMFVKCDTSLHTMIPEYLHCVVLISNQYNFKIPTSKVSVSTTLTNVDKAERNTAYICYYRQKICFLCHINLANSVWIPSSWTEFSKRSNFSGLKLHLCVCIKGYTINLHRLLSNGLVWPLNLLWLSVITNFFLKLING